MTRVLPDLKPVSDSVVKMLGEFFPQAPIDIIHEPFISHFVVGAISNKADAMVAFISIPTAILEAGYKQRVEAVRQHARMAQEHMLKKLETNSVSDLTFVSPDIARAVYEAKKKEKKS